jgi:hypothetical protein
MAVDPQRAARHRCARPRLAEHFVRAEIKHFDYDEFDDAIAWASQAAEEDSRPLQRGPAAPVRAQAGEKT